MKITVIGAGYVGLVTAACFAELGNEVMCVEKSPERYNDLCRCIVPIFEPGLPEMLQNNIDSGRISFTDRIDEGVSFGSLIFLCVGTPESETGEPDMSQIEEAARQIAQNIDGYKLIIEKSTVPVNTHRWVKETITRHFKKSGTSDFDVASNPEFLREGSAVGDFMNPDRIIVGVESEKAKKLFDELYSPFTLKGHRLLITTPAAAELIKHASNSFLAAKISYVNMISDLCEKVGVDVETVAEGMGSDRRIGKDFLKAGLGWGGGCFGKDVRAFIKIAEGFGVDFGMLREVENVNYNRRKKFLKRVDDIIGIDADKNIAVWGLSFKPNTDDIRGAVSIEIVEGLDKAGANLRLYDPKAVERFRSVFAEKTNLTYFDDKYETLKDADALLILTEWNEFKTADLDKVKSMMRHPIVIDGRNMYPPSDMKEKGFEYYCIGRGNFVGSRKRPLISKI